MHSKQKVEKTLYMHTATQTPGQLSGSILPVIIISVALNILLIAALVFIITVFIILAWRKTGTVFFKHTYLYEGNSPTLIV